MKTHLYVLTGSCNSASSQPPQPPSSQLVDLPALSKERFVTWVKQHMRYSISNEKHDQKGLLIVVFLSPPISSFMAVIKWVLQKETWSGRNGCPASLYLLPVLTLLKSNTRRCNLSTTWKQDKLQINSDRLHLEPLVSNTLQSLVQYTTDPSTGLLCFLEQTIQPNLSFLSFS